MAEFPAFPLWTDAYLADTHHLTTIEHGAYLLLLIAMWRNSGSLPDEDRQLAKFAHLTVQQWLRIKPTMMKFFTVTDRQVRQGRLTDELSYVREHSKKQASKARTRWSDRTGTLPPVKQPPTHLFDGSPANSLKNNNTGDAVGMPDACRSDAPTPTPTPISIEAPNGALSAPAVADHSAAKATKPKKEYPADFEAAWLAYPRTRNMSKFEALAAWRKLSTEQRALVLPSIPNYAAFLATKPDFETIHFVRYLAKRRFEAFAGDATPEVTEADWRKRLIYARARSIWSSAEWGPAPGQVGCSVPPDLLVEGDSAGWADQSRPKAIRVHRDDRDADIYRGVI